MWDGSRSGADTRRVLRRLRGILVVAVVLVAPGVAQATSGYVSPFSTSYYVGRTDMGVDLCLSAGDPIRAIGDGVVAGIEQNWFEKQPYIWYELTSGPEAGHYVYVAEQITRLARVGETISAGQTIAVYAKRGTCIETGWSAADGATLAASTTGYREGEVTPAGVSFARFLIGLGLQGTFEITPSETQPVSRAANSAKTKHSSRAAALPTPRSSSRASSARSRPRAVSRPGPATAKRASVHHPAPATPSGGVTSSPPAATGGATWSTAGEWSGAWWSPASPSGLSGGAAPDGS